MSDVPHVLLTLYLFIFAARSYSTGHSIVIAITTPFYSLMRTSNVAIPAVPGSRSPVQRHSSGPS